MSDLEIVVWCVVGVCGYTIIGGVVHAIAKRLCSPADVRIGTPAIIAVFWPLLVPGVLALWVGHSIGCHAARFGDALVGWFAARLARARTKPSVIDTQEIPKATARTNARREASQRSVL